VGDRIDELDDTTTAVVTFAESAELGRYQSRLQLPFPLLADPDRTLYQRFGVGRGSLSEVWGVETLRMYGRLLRAGRRLRRPVDDTRQLGGDFVLDAEHRLVAAFRPRSPSSRPTVDDLIAAVNCES